MIKINVIQTGSTFVSHAVPDRSVDCATNPKEHLGFGLNFASAPIMKKEEGMENQLKRLGEPRRFLHAKKRRKKFEGGKLLR